MTRLADHDLTDLDAFANGFPHEVFALHRREAPVHWHPPTTHTPDGVGFWSVATHAECLAVFQDPATYSSERGGTILPDSPASGLALNMMDDPRHQRVRRLVSGGLTPRRLADLEEELRRRTRALLEPLAVRGRGDFVRDVASELPLQAISILLGTPEADRHALFAWIDHIFDFQRGDAFAPNAAAAEAFGRLAAYATELIAEKRRRPADDMLSVVVHATLPDADPPELSADELQLFFSLLFAAGADTTRNATAGGLLALLANPGELAALRADRALVAPTVEEMVRWTSPSASNRRTATCDAELGGQRLRAGDKVVLWEASANRDERVFAEAHRFRVARQPNPHLAFGHGVHHCLGANLARLEMRVILSELLDRFDAITLDGEAEWTRSNKHTGLRRLPIRVVPRTACPGAPDAVRHGA